MGRPIVLRAASVAERTPKMRRPEEAEATTKAQVFRETRTRACRSENTKRGSLRGPKRLRVPGWPCSSLNGRLSDASYRSGERDRIAISLEKRQAPGKSPARSLPSTKAKSPHGARENATMNPTTFGRAGRTHVSARRSCAACAALLAAAIGCGGHEGAGGSDRSADASDTTVRGLRLMTLNMYLGADLGLLGELSPLEVPSAVGELWDDIAASTPPARVDAMAAAIARFKPHVLGLQEAVLIREQSPSDYLDGNRTGAEDVAWDLLDLLLRSLERTGQRYELAVVQENADIEAPRLRADATLSDARLTDRDAILVAEGVAFAAPEVVTFAAHATFGALPLERGFVAVDVQQEGTTYRVVNTHLESVGDDQELRVPQARQLVDALAKETRPLILLGDFNTQAPDGAAYRQISDNGYRDLWAGSTGINSAGSTCCQSAELRGGSRLTQRIDFIFARNFHPSAVEASTVLNQEGDRTPDGLWPSDHAGVTVRLVADGS